MRDIAVITDTSCLIALAKIEAKRLGLLMTGTLGVLYAAKQKGFITALKLYLELLQTVNFRIAPHIVSELLSLCGE
jgi:predicted nucleic acid-binding protein